MDGGSSSAACGGSGEVSAVHSSPRRAGLIKHDKKGSKTAPGGLLEVDRIALGLLFALPLFYALVFLLNR